MEKEPVYGVHFSLGGLTERWWFYLILGLTTTDLIIVIVQVGVLISIVANKQWRRPMTTVTVATLIVCTGLIVLGLWTCRLAMKVLMRKGCTHPAQLARTREELLQLLRRLSYTLLFMSIGHQLVVDFLSLLSWCDRLQEIQCYYGVSTGELIILGFIACHATFVLIVTLLKHCVFDAVPINYPSIGQPVPRTSSMSSTCAYTYPEGEGSLYLKPSTISSGTMRSLTLPPAPSLRAPTPPQDPEIVEISLDKLV